jgi:hypothetical protein
VGIDIDQVVQYALYGLTAAFGVALVIWLRREQRRAPAESASQANTAKPPTISLADTPSIATALAGIRLPLHWQPSPTTRVSNRQKLTTDVESASELAGRLSDELVRLGYRVESTGTDSAVAVKDRYRLDIDVLVDDGDATVSAHIEFTEVGRV